MSTDLSQQPRRLAIVGGTGAVGRGLALRFAHAGYEVAIGSRDAAKAEATAREVNASVGGEPATGRDNISAAAAGDIVFLTVPHSHQIATVEQVRAALSGKILVDSTVPIVPGMAARVRLPGSGSAVAAVQRLLGEEVRVVSAFQNVSASHLGDLAHAVECDVLVCGDDVGARQLVIDLAQSIGMRAFHAGPIDNSAATEALTSLLISMNIRYKSAGAGIRITGLGPVPAPASGHA